MRLEARNIAAGTPRQARQHLIGRSANPTATGWSGNRNHSRAVSDSFVSNGSVWPSRGKAAPLGISNPDFSLFTSIDAHIPLKMPRGGQPLLVHPACWTPFVVDGG